MKILIAHLDKYQRIRLRNTGLAFLGGLLQSLVLAYAILNQYTILDSDTLASYLVLFWIGNLIFPLLIVSGINLRFSEPSLSLPQMVWAIGCSLFCIAILTNLQEPIYLQIFTVMAFGIFQLQRRQFFYLNGGTCIGFLLVQGWLYWVYQESAVSRVLTVLVFVYCVFALSALCLSFVKLRQRLQQKNDELAHALAVKSQFLANMSHEIRTPMNGVLGMLGILRNSNLPDKQRNFAAIAESSARSLLEVINDILDFSKIEAGKVTLESIDFNPLKEIQELMNTFAFTAAEKKITFLYIVDNYPALPNAVRGDPNRIRQVLTNFLSNALKFTEAGEVALKLSFTIEAENQCVLQYSVSDTGIGLSAEQIAQLFQPFTQADASTTRLYGGTGLGLSIAKRIVDLMEGHIDVSSAEGIGSCFTFTVTLPLVEEHIDDPFSLARENDLPSQLCQVVSLPVNLDSFTGNEKTVQTSGVSDKFSWANPKRVDSVGPSILVVEDNQTNQQVASILLEDSGCRVTLADNGAAALELLQRDTSGKRFDLLLMDCQMPILDGYQTSMKIRAGGGGECYRSVPIIAMTANAMQGDREKCLAAKMDGYLTKPLQDRLLWQTLQKWLPNSYFVKCTDNTLSRCTQTNDDADSSKSTSRADTEKLPWDQQAFARRLKHREDRMVKLVAIFLEDLPERTEAILQAIESNDWESTRSLAHSLKGSSANISADMLSQLMRTIEQRIREGKHLPDDISTVIAEHTSQLEKNLRDFTQQHPLH